MGMVDTGRSLLLPDGVRAVTALKDGTVRVWDAATGAEATCLYLDAGATALAAHGNMLAVGDRFGRVHVFDLTTVAPA